MAASRLMSVGLLVCTVITAHSVRVAGQTTPETPEQPRLLQVTQVRVKPGMMRDFVALQTGQTMPALQKAGIKRRDAYHTMFGEGGEFVFVSHIPDMAQYDGPPPLRTSLGDDAFFALMAKSGQFLSESRTMVVRTRPDLGYSGSEGLKQSVVVFTRVETAPGRARDFEGLLKNEFAPVMQKAQVPAYWVSETVFGGAVGEYHTLTHADSFGTLGKGSPLTRVLGEDGTHALVSKLAGIVERADRWVARYRDDLSFRAAAGTASR